MPRYPWFIYPLSSYKILCFVSYCVEPQQIKYIPQSSYSTKRKHDLEPEYASSSFTYQSKKIRSSSTCSSSSSSRSSSSSSPPLGIGKASSYSITMLWCIFFSPFTPDLFYSLRSSSDGKSLEVHKTHKPVSR